MSTPRDSALVIPFLAVAYRKEIPDNQISEFFRFSKRAEEYSVDSVTSYYKSEMGSGLKKTIYVLTDKISPEQIVDIKLRSFELEQKYSVDGKRTLNIDPGYIDLPKVVLSSFKNFSHRIYLNRGVYAEVTMIYNREKNSYVELPWTYPDYKTDPVLTFLNNARSSL